MSVTVYIWDWALSPPWKRDFVSGGHASLSVEDGHGTYISWWPHAGSPLVTDAMVRRSYHDDMKAMKYQANHSLHIAGLNEAAIRSWWATKKRRLHFGYSLLSENCCQVVVEALAVGMSRSSNTERLIFPEMSLFPPCANPHMVLKYAWDLKRCVK
jgi:hypothetical protein